MLQKTTIFLSKKHREFLALYRRHTDCNVSDTIRRALDEFIQKNQGWIYLMELLDKKGNKKKKQKKVEDDEYD